MEIVSGKTLLLCLLACAVAAHAQQVIAPPPTISTAPRALQQTQPAASQSSFASAFTPGYPLFQWGLVDVRPHLLYRLLSTNGIQAVPGQPVNTTIQEISPGVLFDIGDHWTLDYTPTWRLYSNPAFNDTLDHSAGLTGWTAYGGWTFRMSQSYAIASPVLIETGGQTRVKTYGTSVGASGAIGVRTQLELGAAVNVQSTYAFTSVRDWSTSDWLHYQFSPRFDGAIGGTVGYTDVSPGPNMTYTRPEVKFSWRATDKVSLSAQGGVEHRDFGSSGAGAMNTPTYGATLQYRPAVTTTLTVGTSRGVAPSYFADFATKTTSWNAGLEQRLLERLFLSAGYGRQKNSYVATLGGITAGRNDDSYSFNVRLSTTFLDQGSIAVFYEQGHNSSNILGYGFASHQSGLEIGYRW